MFQFRPVAVTSKRFSQNAWLSRLARTPLGDQTYASLPTTRKVSGSKSDASSSRRRAGSGGAERKLTR